ncbi:MAG: nicotinamidase [Candidatus Yanofskybacteria bacterium]|nr:nicotinamidase [Candidatus Yanofskybacteria bacterium]
MTRSTLPMPPFFDPKNAESWTYGPNQGELLTLAPTWAKRHSIKPSASARRRIHVLAIDDQKDFSRPEGSLFVAGRSGRGAIDDDVRFAQFVYRNLGLITDMTFTLDTHFPFQIFFPTFWVDEAGNQLAAHSLIVLSDDEKCLVNKGLDGSVLHESVMPNPAITHLATGSDNYPWLVNQCLYYVRELARVGKYTLYLWPLHCLMGSSGYDLTGVIHEASLFHALVRQTQARREVKGGNPLTENYSIFRPEVLGRWDGRPLAQKNTRLVQALLEADAVVLAGQAASHCVKSSIEDFLTEITGQDPSLVSKVYILEDCTSSVVVPGADFTPQAEAALESFRQAGMHVVKSTDPIESWPDIRL